MKKRFALFATGMALFVPGLINTAAASEGDAPRSDNQASSSAEVANSSVSSAKAARTPGDPWEGMNRGLYGIGNAIDQAIFRPVAMTYRRVLPRFVRTAARNVVKNLGEPSVAVNDVLQGKIDKAAQASFRFVANTTAGVAGIFDVANLAGVTRHDNDFGITLGKWNLDAGPYLYVPVAGPSSVRDITGVGVDFLLDPINAINFRDDEIFRASTATISALNARVAAEPSLQQLKTVAVDPYATMRSVYLQSREALVTDGKVDLDALPDFVEYPEEPAPDAAVASGSDVQTAVVPETTLADPAVPAASDLASAPVQ